MSNEQIDNNLVLVAARTVASEDLMEKELVRLNTARNDGPHGPTGLGLPRPLNQRELAAAWRVGSAMRLVPDLTITGAESTVTAKPAKPVRNNRLHVRVSNEELEAIKARAKEKHMEVSDYVRTTVLTGGRRAL